MPASLHVRLASCTHYHTSSMHYVHVCFSRDVLLLLRLCELLGQLADHCDMIVVGIELCRVRLADQPPTTRRLQVRPGLEGRKCIIMIRSHCLFPRIFPAITTPINQQSVGSNEPRRLIASRLRIVVLCELPISEISC
jgi:hypothetical protein